MSRYVVYIILLVFLNSCSPIIKTHGYTIENYDVFNDIISNIDKKTFSKEDILKNMGSPSIIVSDVDNYWIYLLSSKQDKSFSDSEVKSQFLIKFAFNENNILVNHEILNQNNLNIISFSKDETLQPSNNYGLSDQLIESLTRSR